MSPEHEGLKEKCARLAALEARVEELKGIIAERDAAEVDEHAKLILTGQAIPRRTKTVDAQREADQQELDASVVAITRARVTLQDDAKIFRNDLLRKLADRTQAKAVKIEELKAELNERLQTVFGELEAVRTGPEARMGNVLGLTDRLLVAESPETILSLAATLETEHGDFLKVPKTE